MLLNNHSNESGNAFLFILIGIVLFAGLVFTVSKSMQSQTTSVMSERDLKIAVSELLSYTQRLDRAIERIRRRGCSENDISFANNVDAEYAHTPAAPDKCKVFHPSGGAMPWSDPPPNSNDGTTWFFLDNRVGTFNNARNIGTSNTDLTLILRATNPDLCRAINKELDNPAEIWESGGSHNGWNQFHWVKFTGDFPDPPTGNINRVNAWPAPKTGCFCDGSAACAATQNHYFYHTLLVR